MVPFFRARYRWKDEIGSFAAVLSVSPVEQYFGAAATQGWRKLQKELMQLIDYNDSVLPNDDDRQGRRTDKGFLRAVSGTQLCSLSEQNIESFVI